MKPLKNKNVSYKIMLMRDDSQVRAFRISRQRLRLSLVVFLCFLLLSVIGWVAGIRYATRFYTLQAEVQSTNAALADMRLQLEALANVKKLVDDTPALETTARNEEVFEKHEDDSAQTNHSASHLPFNPQQGLAALNATQIVSRELTAGHNASLPLKNVRPVLINELSVKRIGKNKIRVRFELTSAEAGKQVSGRIRYDAVLRNGNRLSLIPSGDDSGRFAISWMKKVDLTFPVEKQNLTKQINAYRSLDRIGRRRTVQRNLSLVITHRRDGSVRQPTLREGMSCQCRNKFL